VTDNYSRVFGRVKPVIATVHLGASPGTPLFDSHFGGDTWKAVDPERASEFMRRARGARES